MKYHWMVAILLLNLVKCVINESHYSIIALGTLKSNRRYSVAVTLYDDATEPASIQISIDGPSYSKSKQVSISAGETKQVNFMPPELRRGKYLLRAEGLSGISFKNESILNIDTNSGPKIYIQNDKPIYRPLDVIQFRVVILDEHTRPLNISEPIRVEIVANSEYLIKQFMNITLVKGVFTEKIQLSEHPPLGSWTMAIKSGKNRFLKHKYFQVRKSALPRFSVTIKTPENVTPYDRVIKATIYGKYTFDKYVEGNATVTLSDASWRGTEFEKKQLFIDQTGSVEFKIDDPKKYSNVKVFSLLALLTEKHTGITQSITSTIQVRSQQYNIQILIDQIEYRGNKPYLMKAKVQYWNNVPVLDTKTPVYMRHGKQVYLTHLDAEGIATFEFDHDSMSEHKIRYKDSIATLPNIFTDRRSDSKESPLRLKLMGGRPRLGKMMDIEVSSDDDIPHIIYMVTSHSTIIHKEYIKLPANQKSYIIQIKPSIEMIPRSYVYVHYIQNGNLRYKEMILEFPSELENRISVMAPQEAAPGSEVTINLRAQPASYVCILAVDLSVYLTQQSYDLYKKKILDDLLGDVSYTPISNPSRTVYPGILSGLITLTNAHFPLVSLTTGEFPYATDGFPSPSVRTKLPDTWIFRNVEITKDNTEVTFTIPDTITTWRITAFSMHEVTGLGIVDSPTDIVSIQPFFVNLNLPYSVKRDEILSLPVTVFNYHNQSLDAEITMYSNGQEFDFVDPTNPPSNWYTNDQKQQVKRVKVPSDGVESVSFMIKAKEVGDITLNVAGTTQLSSDAVVQKLKVEPEGAAKTGNKAMLLQISMSESNVATLRTDIPEVIVPESEYLSVSIGGDTMAPTVDNLNGLVLRPTGCGEQNMVNFAPNVLVMQYLKSVGKLETEKQLATQAMQFIEVGFQQQLSFRHYSGGYSVFGEQTDKRVASTWLTAYVIRFFIKAAKFTSIDETIIETGLDYLEKQQLESGEFPFTGYLLYPAQQNRLGCTAFVLMTFLEEKKYSDKYKNVIEKGLRFLLQNNMGRYQNVYALSIMAVTLQMAKHDNAKMILDKLQTHSKEQDGLHWFSADDNNIEKDVEITSYVMLALLETQANYNGILKWLIGQRNAYGGFRSTQDTVVGLQALVKYSEKFSDPNTLKMILNYIAKNELGDELKTDEFSVDFNNSLVLQSHTLPRSTRSITFNATGSGQSMLQLSYNYNVVMGEPVQHFLIDVKSNLTTPNSMTLDVCFAYQPTTNTAMEQTDADNKPDIYSNMIILEVRLPTGFRSDAEFSFELLENELIRRIESKNDETIIVFYLDNLLAYNRNCLRIDADRTHDAMNLKPVPVVMYDYYNTTRSNTKFYTI